MSSIHTWLWIYYITTSAGQVFAARDHVAAEGDFNTTIASVFYISTDVNSDRDASMQKQCKSVFGGIPCVRFQAVTPSELDVIDTKAWSNGGVGAYLRDSDRRHKVTATWLSHSLLLKRISDLASEDDSVYLVVEDDVSVVPNWHSRVDRALRSAPADWDLVQVAYFGNRNCSTRVNQDIFKSSHSPQINGYMGMQGYLVRPASASRVLAALKASPIEDIDGKAILESSKGGFRMYAVAQDNLIDNTLGSNNWACLDQPTWINKQHAFVGLALVAVVFVSALAICLDRTAVRLGVKRNADGSRARKGHR